MLLKVPVVAVTSGDEPVSGDRNPHHVSAKRVTGVPGVPGQDPRVPSASG